MWSQRKRLHIQLIQPFMSMTMEVFLTIDTLESATWWCINIITIRTVKFDCVQPGQVRSARGDDVSTIAVDTGALV